MEYSDSVKSQKSCMLLQQSIRSKLEGAKLWTLRCVKRKPASQRWSRRFRTVSVWSLRRGVNPQSRSYDAMGVAELTLTSWQPRESSSVWRETESDGLRSSTIPPLAADF